MPKEGTRGSLASCGKSREAELIKEDAMSVDHLQMVLKLTKTYFVIVSMYQAS